ncbi:hypothetical protein BC628DRAFT_1374687 [Trametes gibbosa]|nr:hypothetical protein BC628DRAFT_1374687 [Trametes gibbosa]
MVPSQNTVSVPCILARRRPFRLPHPATDLIEGASFPELKSSLMCTEYSEPSAYDPSVCRASEITNLQSALFAIDSPPSFQPPPDWLFPLGHPSRTPESVPLSHPTTVLSRDGSYPPMPNNVPRSTTRQQTPSSEIQQSHRATRQYAPTRASESALSSSGELGFAMGAFQTSRDS